MYRTSSDWDIVEAIALHILAMPKPPALSWVKGHQDKSKSRDSLTLEAQLNCIADDLATTELQLRGSPQSMVPRIASNPVQLHIAGATITTGLSTAIRSAYSLPTLKTYIMTRNQWNPDQYDSVDWHNHQQVMNRFRVQATTVRKFIHRILPTRHYTNRYNPSTPTLCPLCESVTEDHYHLFRCSHPSRHQWRHGLTTSMLELCTEFELPLSLTSLLEHGVNAACYHQSLHPDRFPAEFRQIICQQNILGWHNMLQSRAAIGWIPLIDQILRDNKAYDTTTTGAIWLFKLCVRFTEHFFMLWDARNQVVHGHDTKSRNRQQRIILLAEIRSITDRRDEYLACDRDYFPTSVEVEEKFEDKSPSFMQNWLRIWKPVAKFSRDQAARLAIADVPTIPKFFPPVNPEQASSRPPKPRYNKQSHRRHDRSRHRDKSSGWLIQPITSFFSKFVAP